MSKNILCFSGWGQKFDSLEFIFQEPFFDPFLISSFNYYQLTKVDEFFDDIKSKNLDPEFVIGWSLGGQLAVRLIAKQIIKPKILFLIAPPFQMIKDSRIQAAMAVKTFNEFYNNFVAAPDKTLKQFAILTAMNDKNAAEIARNLDISENNFAQLKMWLEELSNFSCFDVDFSQMPRTVFFQGAGDMIVHQTQAQYFKERIKNFRLEIFENCGHAPQLNNINKVRRIIIEEISTF